MKRKTIYFPAIALLTAIMLMITGCGATSSAPPEATAAPAAQPEPTPELTPDPLAGYSVVGPWGLSTVKNDIGALYPVFGTALRDQGSGMEIKSDGGFSYYLGVTGGSGSYTRDGNILRAAVTDYNENTQAELTLELVEDEGGVYLVMIVFDTQLWWTQNEAELGSPAAPAAADQSQYDGLLSLYYTALSEKYDDLRLSEQGLNYMLMFFYDGDTLNNIGYCFMDMDGDASPELLIAPVGGDEFIANVVFDMYTLVDGAPIQLFSSGERDRWYYLADGTLYNEGSSGAADSFSRQLMLSGSALSEMLQLHYGDAGYTVSHFGSEAEAISDEDADALISGYQANIVKPEYTPLAAFAGTVQ